MKPKYCQGCGVPMTSSKCSDCGWIYQVPIEKGSNHQCAYADNGIQCPLPGMNADTAKPNSEGTKWYCIFHLCWYDDPKTASQNLSAILSGEIKLNKVNWREELINQQTETRHKQNPELSHKPDYDSREYAEMCVNYIKQSTRKTEKLPYKKRRYHASTKEEILTGHEITEEQIENADVDKYFDEPYEKEVGYGN